jgi:bifunctional non-homologous end joining protein LigD
MLWSPCFQPAPFPAFIQPCLATLSTKVPTASDFVHELKLDGYRVQAHLRDGLVTLFTRRGFDWTKRFRTIATDVARLPAKQVVIDGEVIAADENGHPELLCVAG